MRLIVDLTLPVDTRLMAQTRRVVSGYLERVGVADDDVADVVLAVAEACTNVVRHAALEPDECFRLSAEVNPDEVVVVVEDAGVGMASGVPPVRAEDTATSGRGLELIRELMTSVDLECGSSGQGTRLEMRKSLKAAGLSARD